MTTHDANLRSRAQADAAAWNARLRSPRCTDEDRADFLSWRESDPAHAEAYSELGSMIDTLRREWDTSPELRAMRDQAVRSSERRRRWLAATAAAVVLAVGGSGWLVMHGFGTRPPFPATFTHQNGIGDSSVMTLADGTRVRLDSDSRIEVSYRDDERIVHLTSGQALFEVAPDETRPFAVIAGTRQVTALGTVFNVRRDDDRRMRVTLVEGRVQVDSTDRWSGAPARILNPGDELQVDGEREDLRRVDTKAATSWVQGSVIFDDTSLKEVVGEINRYSRVPVRLASPELGEYRVSGVLLTREPQTFLQSLRNYFPLTLEESTNEIVVTGTAPPGAR